jgi:hypothetical protein
MDRYLAQTRSVRHEVDARKIERLPASLAGGIRLPLGSKAAAAAGRGQETSGRVVDVRKSHPTGGLPMPTRDRHPSCHHSQRRSSSPLSRA